MSFANDPVCVHAGSAEICDMKRHPTYEKFRAEAVRAGVLSASSSRLWESMIAMARLCDLDEDDTWRTVVLDCIAPCFDSLSSRVSRDFRAELEEIESAMVLTALTVWADTAQGVSPRRVRDLMVKAAFEAAYQQAKAGSLEHSTDDMDTILQPEAFTQSSALKASSIIDVDSIRDENVAEQIRGERFGALLQRTGCAESMRVFHDELRTGRRSGSIIQSVRDGLPRSWISDPNLYYYTSDLYPKFIGLQEAADVMGITESAAHRLIRAGEFPFPAARSGRGYKVSVKALMNFADIPNAIVHVDDVENGALHANNGTQ
jgi:hypothetical protein